MRQFYDSLPEREVKEVEEKVRRGRGRENAISVWQGVRRFVGQMIG